MDIMFKHTLVALTVVLGTSAWFGCSSDETSVGEDDITKSSCNIFNNQTGKPITPAELKKLNDPVAKKILEGTDCPTSYTAILKKMKTTDNKGCKDSEGGDQKDGLGSFLISETAAHESETEAANGGFRTVIGKTCDKRKNEDLNFSAFANAGQVGDTNVEMIGKDATTGVFNYYEILDGNQWVFYGTSADFIENGYDCKPSGFCVSNNSAKASSPSGKSCASCHVSGGLIMKELDSPWLHWTAGFPKGSDKVMAKHKEKLGNQMQGENLEINVVRPSFDPYNEKRIDILAAKGAAELMRPIFCTMDVNLNSDLVGTNLVTDGELAGGFFGNVDQASYDALKKDVGQKINGLPAKVDDTAFPFTYPTRGQIDTSYSAKLQEAKLVDAEFIKDILAVDFTRPIFSGQRCGLVDAIKGKSAAIDKKLADYAKETTKAKKEPIAKDIAKELPKLYAEVLKGGSKAAEKKFVANLTDPKLNAEAHEKAANDFFAKCDERLGKEKKTALKDIMTYASHVRRVMRSDVVGKNGQDLLEGRGRDDKMVSDNIADNPNALDPTTCELTLGPNQVK
jgi:hypothetical protein